MSGPGSFPDSMTDAEAVAKMATLLSRDAVIGWTRDFDWKADGTNLTAVCWDRDLYKLGLWLARSWGTFERALGSPSVHFRTPGESGRLVEVRWTKVHHPYRWEVTP